jgi:methylmalonyl-CoA mutase cobalamin-binding subunit
VLATLSRYMVGNRTPSRERVLVAGVRGDEHTLELHMIRDQLAAAGYATAFETDIAPERLAETLRAAAAQAIVLGAISEADERSLARAIDALRASKPDVPLVLGGVAAGGPASAVRDGARVLERIDESVAVVEDALAGHRSSPRG